MPVLIRGTLFFSVYIQTLQDNLDSTNMTVTKGVYSLGLATHGLISLAQPHRLEERNQLIHPSMLSVDGGISIVFRQLWLPVFPQYPNNDYI